MGQQVMQGKENPLVDQGIKPVLQMGTLSAKAIRASRINACMNRPHIRLRTSVDASCCQSLRSQRRPYNRRPAKSVLAGIELMHMIRKGQCNMVDNNNMSFAEQFYALAGQLRPA
jgi:hypothetical protein